MESRTQNRVERRALAAVDHQRLLAEEQHNSLLKQINDTNVGQLGLAWYFDLNTHRGIEASPLVIDGVPRGTESSMTLS